MALCVALCHDPAAIAFREGFWLTGVRPETDSELAPELDEVSWRGRLHMSCTHSGIGSNAL